MTEREKKMKYAAERTIGHRRIYGTDHPVKQVVYKAGPQEWIVTVLCNGVAESPRSFRTRKLALEWDACHDIGGKWDAELDEDNVTALRYGDIF